MSTGALRSLKTCKLKGTNGLVVTYVLENGATIMDLKILIKKSNLSEYENVKIFKLGKVLQDTEKINFNEIMLYVLYPINYKKLQPEKPNKIIPNLIPDEKYIDNDLQPDATELSTMNIYYIVASLKNMRKLGEVMRELQERFSHELPRRISRMRNGIDRIFHIIEWKYDETINIINRLNLKIVPINQEDYNKLAILFESVQIDPVIIINAYYMFDKNIDMTFNHIFDMRN
jgi:hypothetical protein